MKSFIANDHPLHLYTYGTVQGLPQEVEIKDANSIIPKSKIFLHKNSYAPFSDLFRWKLLYEQGGIYCDTDMLCVTPFSFTEEVIIGQESFDRLNNAVLKFPAGHSVSKEMLFSALHPHKIRHYDSRRLKRKKFKKQLTFNREQIGWGENAGPPALTRLLNTGLFPDITTKDFTYFYPISPGNFNALFDCTLQNESLFKNTHGIHLWNELLRRNGIDKNQPFHPDSIVEYYFKRYCPNYEDDIA